MNIYCAVLPSVCNSTASSAICLFSIICWRLTALFTENETVSSPQVFFQEASVKQVDVPTLTGTFGILAAHVPTLQVLRPGVVTVFSDDGSSVKYFGETLKIKCGKPFRLNYVTYASTIKQFYRSLTPVLCHFCSYKLEIEFDFSIIRTSVLVYPTNLSSKMILMQILMMLR